MKTEISRFCEACVQLLEPLPSALQNATDRLEKCSEPELLVEPLAQLNDIRARVRSLVEKLTSQQAYLLIFGPLKSGKSTLMNAISGAYVSEVTSLPGYPCLVFVRHSEEPHFSATRYNGRETVFANGDVLQDMIADSHIALAQQIRATEASGADFDPRTHFTEAIRRIDVKVPVHNLAESSTVLVDTPGLYSRMNFGYDVLTREFRDSAACAVFVVKTDNLFLEQVFGEFNQLLGLFSRIFLLINVDTSKRDLHADGSLQPSAESQHPEQIIEAFKTLSMAGPLRRAYEENRVRIHAVDILNAASTYLSSAHGNTNGTGNGQTPPVENPSKIAFDAFLRDLTEYLNSSDYTQEFIRDSLRQGCTLCAEAQAVFESEAIQQVRDTQLELEAEMQDIDERSAAVDRLLKVDWEGVFKPSRVENTKTGTAALSAKAAHLSKEMRAAFDRWFGGNESVKALEGKHWNPLLVEGARSLAGESRGRLRALLGNHLGGAEPAAAVMSDLHTIGFSLAPSGQAALLELNSEEALDAYRMTISEESVPVRKSFLDYLFFRSEATVRHRVLGEDLCQEITPEEKQKRLGEEGRAAFLAMIDDVVRTKVSVLPAQFSERLLNTYTTKFRTDVLDRLNGQRDQLASERAARQTPFESNTELLAALQTLHTQATGIEGRLREIGEQENAPLPPAPTPESEESSSESITPPTPVPVPVPSLAIAAGA